MNRIRRSDWPDYPGNLTAVGSYGGSTSPFGTLDQCGNVWEWIEDERPPSPVSRFFRGGGWNDSADICHSSFRFFFPPEDRRSILGFRPAGRHP